MFGGTYTLLDVLGEGGMGKVYRAATPSGERVAVKVLSAEALATEETVLARFWREADAARRIDSPHITRFLDRGRDEASGLPYLVMELLEGEDVEELLDRLGPLSPDLAVRIALQTLDGLAVAHASGVVHRDIKPANIFLVETPEGRGVKLLDFGVAKFKMEEASRIDNDVLTRTGSVLGSPLYMSPEQARGLKTIDVRADLWSLGIVLYKLVSGQTPYGDIDGLGELILTICTAPPEPVSEVAPWVPKGLSDAMGRVLQLAPEDRFATAVEFAAALEAIYPERGADARRITPDHLRSAIADAVAPRAIPAPSTGSIRTSDASAAIERTVALDDNPMTERLEERARASSPRAVVVPSMVDADLSETGVTEVSDELAAEVERRRPAPEPPPAAVTTTPELEPSSPAPASAIPSERPRRTSDVEVLRRHREAQREVLGGEEARGREGEADRRRVPWTLGVGLVVGGIGVASFAWPDGATPAATTATGPASSSAAPSRVASAPAPPDTGPTSGGGAPIATPASASGRPAPATSVSSAPARPSSSAPPPVPEGPYVTHEFEVSPPFAGVFVNGRRVPVVGAKFRIDGPVGSRHDVIVTARGIKKSFLLVLAADGPSPRRLVVAATASDGGGGGGGGAGGAGPAPLDDPSPPNDVYDPP
ncbi:MAG: serine/threonine-protein kinase [Myxococcota bacterium]